MKKVSLVFLCIPLLAAAALAQANQPLMMRNPTLSKTQIVFSPECGAENQELARTLRSEFVICVRGKVSPRPDGTVNPKLATGQIEVRPSALTILNKSVTPPFQPGAKELPNEDLRLKYRYLDLRRAEMQSTCCCGTRLCAACARTSTNTDSSISKLPCSAAARPRERATTWCPAEFTTAVFMPCPSRRSSISKS